MENFVILTGLIGIASIIVGLARVIPELAIDSPIGFLEALFRGRLFSEIADQISAGWPQTKLDAYFIYGGLVMISIPIGVWWLLP